MQIAHSQNEKEVIVQSDFLSGLRAYASEETALDMESCDDAVHFLYPERLIENATKFVSGFGGATLYAIKANPNPSLIKLFWDTGIRRFETASIREIEMLSAMLPEAEIYFMHPVKSRRAIARAYELGVRNFAFDCADELRKIEEETGHADDLRLFLRLHMEQTDALHPLNDKFGVPMQEAPLVLQRMAGFGHKLGVTFHVGSQCMDPTAYRTALAKVRAIVDQAGVELDAVDVGGGFPVFYPGMEPAPLETYFGQIDAALEEFGFNDLDIMCEPGRALVANAGTVAVRVEMRKSNRLYLNDGTYGALFDAGISKWPYPLEVISGQGVEVKGEGAKFKFYGPTCDSLDVMEGPFELPDSIEEGDWILFHHLGAYGFAMQTKFNGFYSDTVVSIEAPKAR